MNSKLANPTDGRMAGQVYDSIGAKQDKQEAPSSPTGCVLQYAIHRTAGVYVQRSGH